MANEWHWDLAELSASQIVALAQSLIENSQLEFFLESELIAALKSAASAGEVRIEDVSKKVRQQAAL